MPIINKAKIIEKLIQTLSNIRTGVVNSSVLDNINVNVQAWGGSFKINELATVNKLDATTLSITPFDKNVLSDIEKAISQSNLGVNPVNDGSNLKLSFPPMTEENRKERVKELGSLEEQAKIEIRTLRQALIKKEKHRKEDGEITEDDLKRFENDLQKEVDEINKEIENIIKAKGVEIMKI